MRQFTRPTPPVKPTRVTARPDTPFGFGLTRYTPTAVTAFGFAEPSPEDQAWYAETLAGGGHPTEQVTMERRAFGSRMTDAKWDQLADEAAWADAYESGRIVNDRCLGCGTTAGPFTLGYCDDCSVILDRDGEIDPDNGGVCPVCKAWSDFIEPSGLCPSCDLRASDDTSERQARQAW